jgi:hypothetical protein
VSDDAVHQPTWPLLLKIEHMVKLQVLSNNSKTVNNINNLTRGKNDQHSKNIILKLDTLVMILTKFGFHWFSTFRGEDFLKGLRRTTDDDDGCQVMAIAHMTRSGELKK